MRAEAGISREKDAQSSHFIVSAVLLKRPFEVLSVEAFTAGPGAQWYSPRYNRTALL
ncbi:MAG: hypothetical protein V4738_14835 [Pseudomonadota bacterium]